MKIVTKMLLLLTVTILCSCAGSSRPSRQVVVPAPSEGDYGHQHWTPDSNRPIGQLTVEHHSGVDRQGHVVHPKLGADTPKENQHTVRRINDEFARWYNRRHKELGSPPPFEECETEIQRLVSAEPTLNHLQYTREDGKQGCYGLTVHHRTGETRRVENPTTTSTREIYKESEIPAGAKRLPDIRGPERFQPPVGYRKEASTTTTQTTPSSETVGGGGAVEPLLPQ